MEFYTSKQDPKEKVRIKHVPECLEMIKKVVRHHKPEMFIELGTCFGGVPLALNEAFPNMKIYSFDIHQKRLNRGNVRSLCNDNVTFRCADLLQGNCKKLLRLLPKKVRKILYCDNGNKIYEIESFAQFLQLGDLIGVHDWLTRPPVYMRSKKYQAERLRKNGILENTSIVDPKPILSFLYDLGFRKYRWDLSRDFQPLFWREEKNELYLTDPRVASRFWIKSGNV